LLGLFVCFVCWLVYFWGFFSFICMFFIHYHPQLSVKKSFVIVMKLISVRYVGYFIRILSDVSYVNAFCLRYFIIPCFSIMPLYLFNLLIYLNSFFFLGYIIPDFMLFYNMYLLQQLFILDTFLNILFFCSHF
jgi:hypothetical protein